MRAAWAREGRPLHFLSLRAEPRMPPDLGEDLRKGGESAPQVPQNHRQGLGEHGEEVAPRHDGSQPAEHRRAPLLVVTLLVVVHRHVEAPCRSDKRR